jgi:hypothetical protein
MPPDKAAAIKMLLYLLTAGWCKVGYTTPMNVNVSKTPPFTNPPNVGSNFTETQTNEKFFIINIDIFALL